MARMRADWSTERSRARRAKVALAVAAVALVAAGCLGPGVHPVAPLAENTAPPGLWRTLGGDACYWERLSGYGGTLDEIIANDFSLGGPRYVEIKPTDVAFIQQGCTNFFQIWPPGPWTAPLIQQGAPFGDGDWKVNYEVAPGTYLAPGAAPGGGCYWERVSSFTHESNAIIANSFSLGGQQLVGIATTDFGFSADGCGTWIKISNAQPGGTSGPTPPPSGCNPNYDPCVPNASDVDCIGGDGDGPAFTGPVRVIGADPYDLDGNNDGIGCEQS